MNNYVDRLVSVIMPVYNAEKYIESAIKSILDQTYKNIELVIVEDCSTDSTVDILNRVQDPRIKVFFNETNRGIAYSTNRAIQESKGDFIALMDDDDIAASNRIQISVDFLQQHEDIDLVGGAGVKIDENDNILGSYLPRNNPNVIKACLLFKDCMWNGTVTMRRRVIFDNNIWYRDNCYGMQDFQFFMEASKVVKISNINNILLYWRVHSSSKTVCELANNYKLRSERYAQIQRESIKMSGFKLEEFQYGIITSFLTEKMKPSYTKEDWYGLSDVFNDMIIQAKDHNFDWKDELEWQCKKILGERLPRVKWF